ncbi:MAG: heme exporter protein CcmD [Rhodanobacteraceae bacterium]
MADFLAMGGYAGYVWSAYAVFFLVLLIDALAPLVRRRRVLAELRSRFVRQQSRRKNSP